MSAPDGYVYGLAGRAMLICEQCGAMVGFDQVALHDDWHVRLTVRQSDGPA